MNNKTVSVRVRGEFACFTRPESKMERVSYPIMTPSAARGILEAIYWHPNLRWLIREIRVLAPVKTIGILRNEVNKRMTLKRQAPYYADHDRSQRFAVCLRDVDYVIVAEPDVASGTSEERIKHREILLRRVRRGQCYHRPALGTREFAAEFEPADDAPAPIDWTEELGLMLWDMDYSGGEPPFWPLFFEARVENGVMRVPETPIGGRP